MFYVECMHTFCDFEVQLWDAICAVVTVCCCEHHWYVAPMTVEVTYISVTRCEEIWPNLEDLPPYVFETCTLYDIKDSIPKYILTHTYTYDCMCHYLPCNIPGSDMNIKGSCFIQRCAHPIPSL